MRPVKNNYNSKQSNKGVVRNTNKQPQKSCRQLFAGISIKSNKNTTQENSHINSHDIINIIKNNQLLLRERNYDIRDLELIKQNNHILGIFKILGKDNLKLIAELIESNDENMANDCLELAIQSAPQSPYQNIFLDENDHAEELLYSSDTDDKLEEKNIIYNVIARNYSKIRNLQCNTDFQQLNLKNTDRKVIELLFHTLGVEKLNSYINNIESFDTSKADIVYQSISDTTYEKILQIYTQPQNDEVQSTTFSELLTYKINSAELPKKNIPEEVDFIIKKYHSCLIKFKSQINRDPLSLYNFLKTNSEISDEEYLEIQPYLNTFIKS